MPVKPPSQRSGSSQVARLWTRPLWMGLENSKVFRSMVTMFGMPPAVSSSAMRHAPGGGLQPAMEALTCRPGPGDSSQDAAPGQLPRPVGSPRRTVPAPQWQSRKTRACSTATEDEQRFPRTRPAPPPREVEMALEENRGIRGVTWRLQRHREAV